MERRTAHGVVEMTRPTAVRGVAPPRCDTLPSTRLDPLTGLGNRMAFNERLERDRRRADVVIVDLDRFGAVNDDVGREAGDAVLAEVARRIELAVPGSASAYRIGGDDFVVVCEPTGDDPAHRIALAERIVGWIAAPIDLGGRDVHVDAHVGVAQASEFGLNPTVRDALGALRSAQRAASAGWVHAD